MKTSHPAILAMAIMSLLLAGTSCSKSSSSKLAFTYDASTKTLTLSGKGPMPDLGRDESPPWGAYKNDTVAIVIKDGITKIGDDNFWFWHELTSVTIPDSVTSIGQRAFSRTGLTSVTVPKSVKSIGKGAFLNSNLSVVTIPASVTKIGAMAFESSSKSGGADIKEVTVGWKKSLPPFSETISLGKQSMTMSIFGDITKSTLKVPKGSKALYESSPGWKNFGSIVEE
jgi:hypothetical protein